MHYVDFGGLATGPAVVLVHGLGGSHLNWDLFAPLLTEHARVWALDLPGFGRSEPPEVDVVHGSPQVDDPALTVGCAVSCAHGADRTRR